MRYCLRPGVQNPTEHIVASFGIVLYESFCGYGSGNLYRECQVNPYFNGLQIVLLQVLASRFRYTLPVDRIAATEPIILITSQSRELLSL